MGMRDAARAYCEVIEAATGSERLPFVDDVARTLSAVVAAAYRLPEEWSGGANVDEPVDPITHEQWFDRMKEIQSVVGAWDDYWTTFDAYLLDERTRVPHPGTEPLGDLVANLSLADALADIWRDLRQGLDALERGIPTDDVTGEWRLTFRTHWGAHAVEALRALHQQIAT